MVRTERLKWFCTCIFIGQTLRGDDAFVVVLVDVQSTLIKRERSTMIRLGFRNIQKKALWEVEKYSTFFRTSLPE